MIRPLSRHRFPGLGGDEAGRHAARLLRELGAVAADPEPGRPGPDGRRPDEAVRSAMAGAARALEALARRLGRDLPVDGPGLLDRGPPVTVGHARLLAGGDGVLAANLPRPSDWEAVPAWLGWPRCAPAGWDDIAAAVGERSTDTMAARAGELGLAVTPCPPAGSTPTDAQVRHRHGRRTPAPWTLTGDASTSHRTGRLRVVDLSALWAGPLLGALLARFGASVVKVEDPRRGDASRRRPTALTRDLNRSKQLVPASFDGTGRDRLARLLADADIVIEGARPRVLDGLGLGPAHGLGAGQIWISITAHGRSGPWSGRVGFGDDCAAGGGLYHAGRGWPGFVGDAVADPLTGLHGTVAVLAARLGGWSGHIDMALRDTAATVTAGAGSTASEASG